MTFEISNDMDRRVFRCFASIYPDEAAEMNWPEFVAMVKDANPSLTEPEIKGLLEAT